METIPVHFALLVMAVHTSPSVLMASVGWLIRKVIGGQGQSNKADARDGRCGHQSRGLPGDSGR
jgi:hypothetical protein